MGHSTLKDRTDRNIGAIYRTYVTSQRLGCRSGLEVVYQILPKHKASHNQEGPTVELVGIRYLDLPTSFLFGLVIIQGFCCRPLVWAPLWPLKGVEA